MITIPAGIKIRPAALTDLETFRQLRLEALQNHPTAFGQDYDEIVLRPSTYWEQTLKINHEERNIFLAENNNDPIGVAGIARGLTKKIRHSASIWGVYVKPRWRGRHISEALIRACLNWALENQVSVVNLAVVTSNQAAIRVYERCGFCTYGVEPKAIFYDNQFYDEYLMTIDLSQWNR
jgi:RimJ/RimL family protein N-acetyltransferase